MKSKLTEISLNEAERGLFFKQYTMAVLLVIEVVLERCEDLNNRTNPSRSKCQNKNCRLDRLSTSGHG